MYKNEKRERERGREGGIVKTQLAGYSDRNWNEVK